MLNIFQQKSNSSGGATRKAAILQQCQHYMPILHNMLQNHKTPKSQNTILPLHAYADGNSDLQGQLRIQTTKLEDTQNFADDFMLELSYLLKVPNLQNEAKLLLSKVRNNEKIGGWTWKSVTNLVAPHITQDILYQSAKIHERSPSLKYSEDIDSKNVNKEVTMQTCSSGL